MARKKENKSAKIRALLDKGLSQKDIVKKLGVSPQLVYIVARNHGVLTDTQSAIAKKLGLSTKKNTQKKPVKAKGMPFDFIVLSGVPYVLSDMKDWEIDLVPAQFSEQKKKAASHR